MREPISRAEWERLSPAEKRNIRIELDTNDLDHMILSATQAAESIRRKEQGDEMSTPRVYKLNHEAKGRWQEYYSVPSASDASKSYVVAKTKNDVWGCSCPRWIFKKGAERQDCKHIKQVKALIGISPVPETSIIPDTIRKALDRMSRVEVSQDAGAIDIETPESTRAGFLEL